MPKSIQGLFLPHLLCVLVLFFVSLRRAASLPTFDSPFYLFRYPDDLVSRFPFSANS